MKNKLLWTMFLTGALAALTPQLALAVNTASNTLISNRATVNYKVATIAQTAIESSPTGNSTPGVGSGANTTFRVDDKVIFSIASNDPGFVTTQPGSSSVALKFTVSNTGNTVHDFALSHVVGAANTFTATAVTYYKDDGGTPGSYDATDTAITYIDELAAGSNTVVFLVAAVPVTATNGQVASYALKATAHAGGGATALGAVTTANSGSADTAGSVDIVFADIDSDGAGTDDAKGTNGTNSIPSVADGRYNGIYVMWAGGSAGNGDPGLGYRVGAPVLTVTKTSAVYSDPINGTTNPKAIPGAVVTYTITIANAAGGSTATDITIADSLNTEIATNGTLAWGNNDTTAGYGSSNGSFKDGDGTGATTDCTGAAGQGIVVDDACQTDAVAGGDDQADFTANVVNVAASGTLTAGNSKIIKFQVTIQ